MSESHYIVLLNAEVKDHILARDARAKKRLREKFEFLEQGMWDAGVRVKKLKGVSDRVIYEARLTRSERILFSLGRHGKGAAIYLWGIVDHDNVSATVKRILPRNAPFLDFEPVSWEDLPEMVVDEVPAGGFSMEDMGKEVPADYGPQKWLVLTDEQWRRMLQCSDPASLDLFLFLTAEQERLLSLMPPILLAGTAGSGKTTMAVYYLLRREFLSKKRIFLTCSPFLKRFSEGIYDGLVSHTDLSGQGSTARKPDFFVFRDLLREIAEAHSARRFDSSKEVGIREFARIFRNHPLNKKYDAELVWEEIRAIIKGAKSPVSANRLRKLSTHYAKGEMTRGLQNELKECLLGIKNLEFMEKIDKAVMGRVGFPSYDHLLLELEGTTPSTRGRIAPALEEILRIVEKKATRISDPLLTFQEYQVLGRKRAPNFVFDRREIYSIAEYYQGRLEDEGRWDEIDLCKCALDRMNAPDDRFVYDLVVCDEIQDFSDIQLSLVFRLAANRRSVFLSGDPKQIINPSGFRWEEVKNRFFDRGLTVPDVHRLNLNFRCVGNIVRLANALIDLKQRLVGLSDTEMREEWKFNGKPPFLLHGMTEEDVLSGIGASVAGRVLLVRSPEERHRLKERLQTEFVFTINEAKGLEFDTVILWKIAGEKKFEELWRRVQDGNAMDRASEPHLRHELNLLYVAVTRARNTLAIYDGPSASRVWTMDAFRDKLYRTAEKSALSGIGQRVSSPAEWEKQGDYFFEREYYPAAVECYKNAGNRDKMSLAEAYVFGASGRHAEAAVLFEMHGRHVPAAENYEKCGEFRQAMTLWEKVKDKERARSCRIRMLEAEGRHGEAAAEWEKLGEYEHALENWEKAGSHARIGRYYLSKKKYDKAGASFERAQDHASAAACFKKGKKYKEAADLYYRAGDMKNAAILYKKLKNTQRLLACYQGLDDHYAAARLYESSGEIEKAASSFSRFAELSPENRERLALEAATGSGRQATLKSAVRWSALGMHDKSAPIYLGKGLYEIAISEYRTIGDRLGVSACHAKAGRFFEAALVLENSDVEDRLERTIEFFMCHVYGGRTGPGIGFHASYDKKRAERLFQEATALLNGGNAESALARFAGLRDPQGVLDAYLKLDRDEEALRFFLDRGMFDYAGRYVDKRSEPVLGKAFLKARTAGARQALIGGHAGAKEYMGFMARLLRGRLRRPPDEDSDHLLNELLYVLRHYRQYKAAVPASILELALAARRYDDLFRVAEVCKPPRGKPRLSDELGRFFDALKQESDRTSDRNLLAIWYFLFDAQAYEFTLRDLEITGLNFALFTESQAYHHKAVGFLIAEKRVEEAARVYRIHAEYADAARLFEEAGDRRAAAEEYMECKMYEDALRCYKQAQDARGMARAHEGMRDYAKALGIWRSVGSTRDVNRVLKKVKGAVKPAMLAQDDLF